MYNTDKSRWWLAKELELAARIPETVLYVPFGDGNLHLFPSTHESARELRALWPEISKWTKSREGKLWDYAGRHPTGVMIEMKYIFGMPASCKKVMVVKKRTVTRPAVPCEMIEVEEEYTAEEWQCGPED